MVEWSSARDAGVGAGCVERKIATEGGDRRHPFPPPPGTGLAAVAMAVGEPGSVHESIEGHAPSGAGGSPSASAAPGGFSGSSQASRSTAARRLARRSE